MLFSCTTWTFSGGLYGLGEFVSKRSLSPSSPSSSDLFSSALPLRKVLEVFCPSEVKLNKGLLAKSELFEAFPKRDPLPEDENNVELANKFEVPLSENSLGPSLFLSGELLFKFPNKPPVEDLMSPNKVLGFSSKGFFAGEFFSLLESSDFFALFFSISSLVLGISSHS